MNKIIYLIIICFILALGFSISHWVNKPFQAYAPHNTSLNNCMSCHQNSITQGAWKGVPAWHNKKFCNPKLEFENREEHRRIAHNHRNECMTCHTSNFQVKCAECHTQNEWK